MNQTSNDDETNTCMQKQSSLINKILAINTSTTFCHLQRYWFFLICAGY